MLHYSFFRYFPVYRAQRMHKAREQCQLNSSRISLKLLEKDQRSTKYLTSEYNNILASFELSIDGRSFWHTPDAVRLCTFFSTCLELISSKK